MSWVLVTPNMHKAHHHLERPWTNRNDRNNPSLWDRLFRPYAYADLSEIEYGLDVLDGSRNRNLGYLLQLPFSKCKTDY